MTLILGTISRDYVSLVADRRLVQLPSRKLVDDSTTKVVLFNNFMVFAYTGLAELPRSLRVRDARGGDSGRQPTNLWLGEVLALANDLDAAINDVRCELDAAVKRLPWVSPEHRGVAFVGVGYMTPEPGGPLQPRGIVISNLRDRKAAEVTVLQTEGGDDLGSVSSHDLPRGIRIQHDRLLKECRERALGPAGATRVLRETIRAVAERDKAVGKGLLQVCVPRQQVDASSPGGEWLLSAGPPGLDHVTFQHVPPGDDDGVQYGPTVVLGDKTVIGQLNLGGSNQVRISLTPPERLSPQ